MAPVSSGQTQLTLRVLDSVSDRGAHSNEDLIVKGDNVAWVIDGATSLSDGVGGASETNIQWLLGLLNTTLSDGGSRSLMDQVAEACAVIHDDFTTRRGSTTPERYEAPSAVGVGIRLSGEFLEVLSFGDCQLILQTQGDEPVHMSPESQLKALDDTVIEQAIAGTTGAEQLWDFARRELMAQLRANRNLLNKPEGYGAISVFGEFPTPHHHSKKPVTSGTHGLLVSDGFMALVADYDAMSPEHMLTSAIRGGVGPLLTQLRAIEAEDSRGSKFPRLKQHDDASALLFSIG